jgi:nicotinamidase/pyrazinamidase
MKGSEMKPAIVIVDMLKNALHKKHGSSVATAALSIVSNTNRLTEFARSHSIPVIFAMDSFLPGDFIFQGKMNEHSIRGTEGAEVMDELIQSDSDLYLPKRRFSAFFKTDFDQTLRLYGVDTIAITGLNTHWCVLTTAMDALSNDFRAYIIEDCCAAYKPDIHEATVNIFRHNPLYPLFQVMSSDDFMKELL